MRDEIATLPAGLGATGLMSKLGIPKWLRGGARRVRALRQAWLQAIVRRLAARAPTRRILNSIYSRLSSRQRIKWHESFAKIFRGQHGVVTPGIWSVEFVGRRIALPITADRVWLEWDTALSILGHDVDVKETYATLIASGEPPELFIDVGTNYGTHSLLFLVHQIATISFEPNAKCQAYFKEMCTVNNVVPSLNHVALGESQGSIELYYPEADTWLGSTDPKAKAQLQANHQLAVTRVPQATLDDYLGTFGARRMLIKIDTEGAEYQVLAGASRTLDEKRPLVIFETLESGNRERLFACFGSHNYCLAHLPLLPGQRPATCNMESFVSSPATNFIALPSEVCESSRPLAW